MARSRQNAMKPPLGERSILCSSGIAPAVELKGAASAETAPLLTQKEKLRQSGRRLARHPAGQTIETAPTELSRRGKNASGEPKVPDGRAVGGVARAAWLE